MAEPKIICPRFGKFFGCYFEPRYDKGPAEIGSVEGNVYGALELAEKSRKVTYVCDVCVRCGRTIKRG